MSVALSEPMLGHFMERYYTANGKYLKADGSAPALPFTEAPKDGSTKVYTLGFAAGNPTASKYVLQAVPKGGMANDKCGTLTLSNTGAKGQKAGMTLAECWKR